MNALFEQFINPPMAYRGKPFWSWNGKLDRDELFRQIHIFKEMGFGGFFMHSRTGLITEYLGDEWFDLINACAEEAERLGMEAWLYDEDRWPSGTAGGLVTQEPRFRLKFIRLQVIPAADFVWADDLVAAFSCKLDGMAYTQLRQLHGPYEKTEYEHLMHGEFSILAFTIETQNPDSFYNGFTYLDTLNREAVERFLELTHEKYLSKSGHHFGHAIKGIFTDEPHRGPLMDGAGITNDNAEWMAPWTYTLFERFAEKYDYDLVPLLPELFLQPEGNSITQVKWHYADLLQDLFQESYARPVNEWCQHHNLILTGHTLHEDSLTAQSAMVGSVMRFYEQMGYPGVDVLVEGNVNYWIVKQLSSSARQLGQPWLLSELYGCTGWQMPFAGHKAVGDWQALLGINVRCHHLSWYTMEGEAKRDFPASISYQSGWWNDYNAVETYFSRLGLILSQGKPICDLLVINPVESVWCQIYPGWSRILEAKSPPVLDLERRYQETFHLLAGAHIDFDYGDEEMMSRMYALEFNDEGGCVLRVGEAVYKTVLLTGMTTIRASTLNILEEFRQSGGRVIFAGDAPAYVDAKRSEGAVELALTTEQIPFTKEDLLNALCAEAPPLVTVVNEQTNETLPEIYIQTRRDQDVYYVVLLNMNRQQWQRNARVRISLSGTVEEWNCLTGEHKSVPTAAMDQGYLQIDVDFPPAGEHVYRIRTECPPAEADHTLPSAVRYADTDWEPLYGPYSFKLNEPNVCVLDRASYRLGDRGWSDSAEILKVDRSIRETLGLSYRSGEMVQPWYREKYLQDTLQELTPLVLRFEFMLEFIASEALYLAIERPERTTIKVNGHMVTAEDLTDWWIDPCFVKIMLPATALTLGVNTVELSLMYHPGVDLEAIYVLGDFGVHLTGELPILTPLPERLEAGDITLQGLPFYGGTVTYMIEQDQVKDIVGRVVASDKTGNDLIAVAFPDFDAALIAVREGSRRTLLPWHPYEAFITGEERLEIDLSLTRRNTFGPLHQLPLHAPYYGPPNWVTEGEFFSNDHVLLPSGLLREPRLVHKKPVWR